jgi:hypothetical protein
MKIDMGITYRDQLRRTSGDWRIARRAFILHWTRTVPVELPPDQRPAVAPAR